MDPASLDIIETFNSDVPWCLYFYITYTAFECSPSLVAFYWVLFCFVFTLYVFQLSSALLFDAVHTVVAAVQELNRSQNVGATQLSCKSSKIWEHGTSLMNYLRMVRRPTGKSRDLPVIPPTGVEASSIIWFSLCTPAGPRQNCWLRQNPRNLTRLLKINDHQFVITASFNVWCTVIR